MLVIGSSTGEVGGLAVNLAVCAAFGPCRKDIVLEKPSGKRVVLGAYESEERAQEVYEDILDEYMEFYGNGIYEGEADPAPWAFTPPKIYRMPEE